MQPEGEDSSLNWGGLPLTVKPPRLRENRVVQKIWSRELSSTKARRTERSKSSGERWICFNEKGQSDKNKGCFCKVYWWITDGALTVGPLAHQSPAFGKLKWTKTFSLNPRSDENRDRGWCSLWWTHRAPSVSWVMVLTLTLLHKHQVAWRAHRLRRHRRRVLHFPLPVFTAAEGGAIAQVSLSHWLTSVFLRVTNAAWAPF